MKALLEQNFDDLYVIAKDRIEKCIKAMEQMTTFRFFVIWNTINEILFDVFHDTRFMWVIAGCETDSKLTICFHDKLMNLPTKKIDISILNEFKLISFENFCKMSYKEMLRYMETCYLRGCTNVDLSRHFGQSDNYVTSMLSQRRKGRKSRVQIYGIMSMIVRETIKLIDSNDIPLINPVFKVLFPEYSNIKQIHSLMFSIHRGKSSKEVYVDEEITKEANAKFIAYLRETKLVVNDLINHDTTNRVYNLSYSRSLGCSLHLKAKTTTDHGRSVCWYEGESLEKLKRFHSKVDNLLKSLTKEGGKKK